MDYNKYLNQSVQSISPSGIRKFFDIANEMDNVISLSIGEPDFQTPWHIRDEGIRSLEKGKTFYSPNRGFSDLLKEITNYYERRFSLTYSPADQTLVTVGGSEAIDLTFRTLVEEGDEVIIPQPSFVCYTPLATMAGGTPVVINTKNEDNFRLKASDLEAAITPKSKLLVLPFPNNPTGAILEKRDLLEIAEVVKKHDLIVLSDEIYCELTYGGRNHVSIASIDGMYERTVVVNGFSKSYAMTGWRLGWVAAPEWIVKGINKLQGQYTSGTCDVSQMAALAAYQSSQECVEEMRKAFEKRRDLIVGLAREIPGLEVNVPEGAFYLFPKCSSFFGKSDGKTVISNSTDFAMYLLQEGHVATVGGDAFGDPDCFRMSYATSDDNIKEAMRRIKEVTARLK